jgi:hypothetical protein
LAVKPTNKLACPCCLPACPRCLPACLPPLPAPTACLPQVQWEFWTNSNDQCGPVCDVQKEFIKEFVPVAKVGAGVGWVYW